MWELWLSIFSAFFKLRTVFWAVFSCRICRIGTHFPNKYVTETKNILQYATCFSIYRYCIYLKCHEKPYIKKKL